MCNAEYIITVQYSILHLDLRAFDEQHISHMSSFVPSIYIGDLITFLDVLLMTSMNALITMLRCFIVSGGSRLETPLEYPMRLELFL